ncbi:uncharacterized protein LOC133547165 [Nerophis ophidion]|uniref:uncharacterized protein LOC133547165 n=1 Tax=Nerophis ophidion TaxID=159077 RepID=UPI002AE05194|nr:uncharacterized protein LOC133547165 [Nerophis ophidion]
MSEERRNPTGYGPRHATGGRWQRLVFDGDEDNYKLWEVKCLGRMRLEGLKDTILSSGEVDPEKNAECFAELIQFLDDKSLSLVMRDAADDGRKALQILRRHYASDGKPRIISLYNELCSLKKNSEETITDYIIRAEKIVTSLRNTKQVISDELSIAMVLRGLPEPYKPFVIHMTQSNDEVTFVEFKSKLRSYEETEKFEHKPNSDNVMKVDIASATCYGCGNRGHFARNCPHKTTPKWCNYHRSTTHTDETCRRKTKPDSAKQTMEKEEDSKESGTSFVFQASHLVLPDGIKQNGLMVDCGATSHIITEKSKFTRFDDTFNPNKHYMELANGTRKNNVALKRGDAVVLLRNTEGKSVPVTLKNALFIPIYPQDFMSVKAATTDGAQVIFEEGQNRLITKEGNTFKLEVHERLYYLKTGSVWSPTDV